MRHVGNGARLSDDDVDRIADRVVDRLLERGAASPGMRLVDAAQVAARLGVTRNWVYAHADALGALTLPGSGRDRPRKRFDLEEVVRRLSRPEAPPQRAPRPRRGGPRPQARPGHAPLIDYET